MSEKRLKEPEKKLELTDELLDQVVGGAINVFDAPSPKEPYYKCTCHACSQVGVGGASL